MVVRVVRVLRVVRSFLVLALFGAGVLPSGCGGKAAREADAGLGEANGPDGAAGGNASDGGAPKFVGNITTRGAVRDDFATYWNQITPENEGKWGSVERVRGEMNWSGLDAIYAYTKQHGVVFKEHTFVWGNQQPAWIKDLPASEQAAEVEEWIRLFCERYPDVALIDVVNEPPPHTTPPYMDALGGAGSTGYDWIATAFRWARTYCPKATLVLNDYNVLNWESSIATIATALKGQGLIDALGSQSHGQETTSLSTLRSKLETLKAVGLPIYITEFDVDLADDAQQLQVFQDQIPLFWNEPQIKGITLWGYVLGSTWISNSGLIHSDGTPRPAMTWLMQYIGR